MERPAKRARGGSGEPIKSRDSEKLDDDEQALLQLLDGKDGFKKNRDEEDEEAARRRDRRRQRMARLETKNQALPENNAQDDDDVKSSNNKQNGQQEAAVERSSTTDVKDETDSKAMDKDEDDDFDMFSSSVSPVQQSKATDTANSSPSQAQKRGHEQGDWDDAEGYYKAVIGETIEVKTSTNNNDTSSTTNNGNRVDAAATIRFKVAGVVGKGVFSTVLKCSTVSNASSVEMPPTIAMKCVRHNETMAKAAAAEIKFLQQLNGSPGIVPLLLPTTASTVVEYRGHVLLVFPYLEYNLRDVLQKFGKGVGLSLQAVRSFFGQLCAAASHLKRAGIIHADLKPDNILVSGDYSTVYLADFGSAFDEKSPENQPTPYLVSRFYRAPEIILGLTPTSAVDLWSLAVTVAEIFLGDVLFRGKSNNDMLYVFQQKMGPFSNRVIRQHLAQCAKLPNMIPRQFKQEGTNYCFMQQVLDPISGQPVKKHLPLSTNAGSGAGSKPRFPLATPLNHVIMKAKSSTDSRALVSHFVDLLHKSLALDPSRRIALKDALQHPFFRADVDGQPRNSS